MRAVRPTKDSKRRAALACLALATFLSAAGGIAPLRASAATPLQAKTPAKKTPDEAAIRRAWSFLNAAEQEDALEEYEARAEYTESFTSRLVKFALTLDERDRGLLPLEPSIPYFDPLTHAPAQPITRRALDPDSEAARAATRSLLGKLHKRRLAVACRYDYAVRDVVKLADPEPLARRFENALAGALPMQDYAEALVERALDNGAQYKTLAAFAHAYTDRLGNIFPGITLYDAWSSGADLEMPDVDVLGVVHTVLDEWKKWKAPVPASQHKALYDRVGKLFQDARRHRGLRAAYARCYLGGASELEPLYSVCVERLHFAWDEHKSEPKRLLETLPVPDKWNQHLATLEKDMLKAKDGRSRALVRIETLAADAAQLRALWVEVLDSRGAFERTSKPPSAPGK
jgi:hypothetical protein